KAEKSEVLKTLALQKGGYAVLTLHRPGNVDDRDKLGAVLAALGQISVRFPVVFPVHPRTANLLKKFGIRLPAGLKLLPPLGYLDFLNLMMNCRFMLTDSGGIQEETTMLGIPCLTLRDSTERPVTVTEGTNTLVGSSRAKLVSEAGRILKGRGKGGRRPERWDGQTAARIVRILMGEL
ncbi:MAG TPA: UDP-N-acetylglucosamine 2-epimerase, partial [Candidatus Sulfotelmatobacter sp.]|nr:UDP-N-acetylglucosamine 2-epimerase [Candidatus Sulfotelmatobacter sp.]